MFARGIPAFSWSYSVEYNYSKWNIPLFSFGTTRILATDIDFTFAYQITDKTLNTFMLTWFFWNNICVLYMFVESTQFRYNLVLSTDED